MADPDPAQIARQFMNAVPFAKALQLNLEEIGDGRTVLSMPYNSALIGDPDTGVIHGGAVSALMDTCGGAAVLTHPDMPIATATIDLRIDYMRAATPGQRVFAEAICYHVTREVAFVRAKAWDENDEIPIASAVGAFTFQRGQSQKAKS